jgi:hypothetical protein
VRAGEPLPVERGLPGTRKADEDDALRRHAPIVVQPARSRLQPAAR